MPDPQFQLQTHTLPEDGSGKLDPDLRGEVAHFLHTHLDAYGDPLDDILACLDYAERRGGSVTVAREEGELLGAVVVGRTGMGGFIPENILVYIAVSGAARGRGLGGALMEQVFEHTEGDIALHVEPDNPARRLYERLGFSSRYLEMRRRG